MAIKKAANKAITEKSDGVKDKAYSFPGNPPVTVTAKSYREALEKYKKLSAKK